MNIFDRLIDISSQMYKKGEKKERERETSMNVQELTMQLSLPLRSRNFTVTSCSEERKIYTAKRVK